MTNSPPEQPIVGNGTKFSINIKTFNMNDYIQLIGLLFGICTEIWGCERMNEMVKHAHLEHLIKIIEND